MNRHALFAAVWAALALGAWLMGGNLLWVPLLFLTGLQVYRALKGRSSGAPVAVPRFPENAPVGKLGRFTIDGDESFGLFLELAKAPVFVDLREDEQIENRKTRALYLADNVRALESSLAAFRAKNTEFLQRQPTYIGLHSSDPETAEVFWEPDGHTALRGLEFVK